MCCGNLFFKAFKTAAPLCERSIVLYLTVAPICLLPGADGPSVTLHLANKYSLDTPILLLCACASLCERSKASQNIFKRSLKCFLDFSGPREFYKCICCF